MNLFLKGCLITGVTLIAAGSVITAFDYAHTLRGAQEGFWPGKTAAGEASLQAVMRESDEMPLRCLDIELSGGKLQIAPGEEFNLQIGEKLQPYIRYELEDGVFSLRDTLNERWWNRVSNWGEDYSVVLSLPEKDYAGARISIGAGEADIRSLKTDTLLVESGAGEMRLQEITAQDAELSCGAGEFTAHGLRVFKSADIGCGVGEFDLAGDLRGEVSVSGGVGGIRLRLAGEEEEYSISASTGIGVVRVGGRTVSTFAGGLDEQRKNAENSLDISCGVGEIDVQFSEDIDKSI